MEDLGKTGGQGREPATQFTGVKTREPLPTTGISEPLGPPPNGQSPAGAAQASRRWRTVWRIHFYAGMLALPVLVLLSLTGLVILYTDPVNNTFGANLRTVVPGSQRLALEEQRTAVMLAFPKLRVSGMTMPAGPDRATVFSMTDDTSFRDVFVNPYTAEVLGSAKQGSNLIGLANRLHGALNLNDGDETGPKVKLPMLSGIFGEGPAFIPVPAGEVIVEVFACWALILAATGIFLWWPRKSGTGKALFLPRWSRLRKGGRARWRDLHALPGIVFSGVLVFFVTTGLPWSGFWGENWSFLSKRITPPPTFTVPASGTVQAGDLDRFGNRIDWAVRDAPVPASGVGSRGHHHEGGGSGAAGSDASGPRPASLPLDAVARIAETERMQPGYSIALPVDTKDEGGRPIYGSFTLTDAWPARLHTSATVYVDQFSGQTLARMTPYDEGALSQLTSFGIQTHMGTQYGLVTRIAMTLGCLLLLWMAFTAVVMWWKRRPRGKAGLPRRSADAALPKGLRVAALAMGVVYPLWAASAVLVLLVDRLLIRRVPRLSRAFGMR